jgi:hypothetical protein
VATDAFVRRSQGEARREAVQTEPMQKKSVAILLALLLLSSCSARDFLTRRLAADLISASDPFKAPQQYTLQTGVISTKDYAAPEYQVLQRHGWISASTISCPAALTPPPCWDILLTPSGVETVRTLVPAEETARPSFSIPVARRQFVAISGISKQGTVADVDFIWKWSALNEIGAALYSSDLQYKSTVGFREYDDGWRVVQTTPHAAQTLDDALKNSEPTP